MSTTDRKLRVFLCHSSQDKPVVRELNQRLLTEGWIDPWLDEEKLLPGQDWDLEIEKAVEAADVVIVCLSTKSVNKEGYVQRELRFALDIALEKPEGTIFIIPLKLEDCEPPRKLRTWHYLEYFPPERRSLAHQRLLASLKVRAEKQFSLLPKTEKDHLEFQDRIHTEQESDISSSTETQSNQDVSSKAVEFPFSESPMVNNEPISVGLYGANITKSRLYMTSLLIGAFYVVVVIAGMWFLNNSTVFRNYEWLLPLGVIRGVLVAYVLLKNDQSSNRITRGKISSLGSALASLPFLAGTLFIILLLIVFPPYRLNISIIILIVVLDIILGILSAWITGYSLPVRSKE